MKWFFDNKSLGACITIINDRCVLIYSISCSRFVMTIHIHSSKKLCLMIFETGIHWYVQIMCDVQKCLFNDARRYPTKQGLELFVVALFRLNIMSWYLNKSRWEKIALMSPKGSLMDKTTVNCVFIIFIMGIRIIVVRYSILDNSLANIVPMHMCVLGLWSVGIPLLLVWVPCNCVGGVFYGWVPPPPPLPQAVPLLFLDSGWWVVFLTKNMYAMNQYTISYMRRCN